MILTVCKFHFFYYNLRITCLVSLLLLADLTFVRANDIQVSNTGLVGQVPGSGYTFIAFDLSWKNSWRHPVSSGINNWDAAWVFAKFRAGERDPQFTNVSSSGNVVTVSSTSGLRVGMPVIRTAGGGSITAGAVITAINSATTFTLSGSAPNLSAASITCYRIWEHARLHSTGHLPGTGMIADPGLLTPGASYNASSNPALGVFIYRDSPGRGDVSLSGVQLRWNYADNGLSNSELVEVRVFAVEMVYVPQGAFFVGSGGTESGSFTDGSWISGATIPFRITSENQLTIAAQPGALWGTTTSGTGTIGDAGTLPASFPKGFGAFYLMKYEASQQQYVDFVNTLTFTQQSDRIPFPASPGAAVGTFVYDTNRNGIRIAQTGVNPGTPAVYETTNPFVALNRIAWVDHAAYMDWSGLRPMTELEFVKATRGFGQPVPEEYAWGTASISSLGSYTLSDPGTANEAIAGNYSTSGTEGNANYSLSRPESPFNGTMRVGIFSTQASNRVQAGASFFGIMELSGSLWERIINVSTATGRAFTGLHGNGVITGATSDVTAWPVTDAIGEGYMGGSWNNPSASLTASNRSVTNDVRGTTRLDNRGFRAARTAGCVNTATAPSFDTSNGLSPSAPIAGTVVNYKVIGSGSFLWTVPGDWVIISGQGTDQIRVLVGAQPARLRVAAYADCGAGTETCLNC